MRQSQLLQEQLLQQEIERQKEARRLAMQVPQTPVKSALQRRVEHLSAAAAASASAAPPSPTKQRKILRQKQRAALERVCEDRARMLMDASRAHLGRQGKIPTNTGAAPSTEQQQIYEMIVAALSAILMLQECGERGVKPPSIASILAKLEPRSSANRSFADKVKHALNFLHSSITLSGSD